MTVVTAYRNYEFHDIYQEIHNFCVVELGGFYLDIIKDRLYTTGADSKPRRSAQTAVYHVAQAMVRWLAPILSFTAEEAWGYLPKKAERIGVPECVASLSGWCGTRSGFGLAGAHCNSRPMWRANSSDFVPRASSAPPWKRRSRCSRPRHWPRGTQVLGDELRFLLITSYAKVVATEAPPETASKVGEEGVWIEVKPSTNAKCIRCYQLRADVGSRS